VYITINARARLHHLSPVLENLNKAVNTLCSIYTYSRNTNMIYRKQGTLIGTHTCPMLLFVRRTTMKAMQEPDRKCARGKKLMRDCANICIVDLGKDWGCAWALIEREFCPVQ
jgi:hypothetical protein